MPRASNRTLAKRIACENRLTFGMLHQDRDRFQTSPYSRGQHVSVAEDTCWDCSWVRGWGSQPWPGPFRIRMRRENSRGSSLSKRTWGAHSKFFYTPPTSPPPDAPPALAFDRIAALDAILSDYQPDSELSRLSLKAGGPPTAVSADLFDVLERSKQFHEQTGGVFDVTIAPVGRLWRRARRDHKLPDPRRSPRPAPWSARDKMVLDPKHHTVQLTQAGHEARRRRHRQGVRRPGGRGVLRKLGITRALVGGAGDIVVGDPPPDAQGWTIAVAALNPSEAEPETYLLLKNAAISTAGDAERFVIIGGRRYSHIINPVTGAAVEDRASVTVVAPDGAHGRRPGDLGLPAWPGARAQADRGDAREPPPFTCAPRPRGFTSSSRLGSRDSPDKSQAASRPEAPNFSPPLVGRHRCRRLCREAAPVAQAPPAAWALTRLG